MNTEAERASKAWLNMLSVLPKGKGLCHGRDPRKEARRREAEPRAREYRWVTLGDGRKVYRPVVQHTESKRSHLPTPQLSPDYRAYDCPITGRMIEGRRAHRENLKRHNCRVLEPGETEQHRRDAPRERAARLERAIEESVNEAAKEYFV